MALASCAVKPEPNVRIEMKAHRERLKQAVHPGVTQKEAGLTPEQAKRLVDGVCADLAAVTEQGERWANWTMVILAVVLVAAMGVGLLTHQGRWRAVPERAVTLADEPGGR